MEKNNDARLQEYVTAVQEGRESEAQHLREAIWGDLRQEMTTINERLLNVKSSLAAQEQEVGNKVKNRRIMYRDLMGIYREAQRVSKETSELKRFMREEGDIYPGNEKKEEHDEATP